MSAPPVAYDGIAAKTGEKKTETKNQNEAEMAVRPVLPPSEIPAYTHAMDGRRRM
jgi:hypothetical protein